MNETLKPCPFCDNEMHFIPTDQPKGWLVDGRHKSSCPFSIMTYDDCTAFVTREAAAESWNTRSDYAVQAENERKAELGSWTCEKDQLEAALALSRGMVDMAARREIYKDNRIADLEQLVRDMYDVAASGEFDVGEESKFSERMAKLGVVDKC